MPAAIGTPLRVDKSRAEAGKEIGQIEPGREQDSGAMAHTLS